MDRTGNAEFCAEVTKWAFHERGVLRVSNERHNHAGSSEQPDWYRVSDDLEFALDIHEFSEGSWKPYRCAAAAAAEGCHHKVCSAVIGAQSFQCPF